MNVERLHRVIYDFKNDLEKTNILVLIQNVRDNLQNVVNQPNQPSYQTNLVASIEELNKGLNITLYIDPLSRFKLTPNTA